MLPQSSWSTVNWDCVVGLGSNLGDRLGHIRVAVSALGSLGEVRTSSRVYETAPVGGPPQPPFLNAAARVETPLSPRALLDALHAIERAAGRIRRERWGPRTVDLDVLWIRGLAVFGPDLTVPHPRLLSRAFALIPLLEVAPDAIDPRDGAPYASHVAKLDRSSLLRVLGPTFGASGRR